MFITTFVVFRISPQVQEPRKYTLKSIVIPTPFRELVHSCIKLFMQYIVKVKKDLKECTFIELTQICTISLFLMI